MSKRLLNLCMTALLSVVTTAAWALSEVNGVYQIGTADDLKAFAELVNGGKADARAVLTADIDKGMDGTMIGRDGLDFQGIFDGNGHTITINLFSDGSQGTALFRNVGVRGLIQNLKVQGTITTDQKFASGIAVWSNGIIRGCYIDLTVNSSFAGDATHGGLVAVARRGTVLENNLVKFKILGATTQNCGGLIGWCDHPVNAANNLVITDGSNLDITNNGSANIARNGGNVRSVNLETYNQDIYANRPNGASSNNYVTNQWGDNAATSVVAYDNLADGRICYQLNTDQSKVNWVQTIGVDPFPVPAAFGSGQVYASGPTDCDGKSEGDLTFSNSGTAQATAHTFDKYGICSACGCFNFQGLEFSPEDNAYLLKTAADIDLAEGWNRIGDGFKVDMKMANDIEYTAEKNQYIFNTSNWVDGNFNGDGHQLTIIMDIEDSNASFIPQFSGTFENVIMHGSITTAGQYAGSITSHTRNSSVMVRNVFSDIEINTTHPGDNTTGGFFGVVETKTQVENAIYAGNINGNPETTECLAGFSGWASGQTYYTNCAFLGTLNGAIGDSKTLSRNPANITCTNVYFANSYGYEDEAKATLIENAGDIESGALAYGLNGNESGVERFYQKIGEDLMPMPIKKDGALVYASASSYRCDGQPEGSVTYSNTPSGSPVLPPHQYEEGFCTVCGSLQEDFLTPVDGWFEISNGAELLWWSHYASRHLDASAKLTDDIDMDGYSDRWADVGTEGAPFYGNFDGQYHTISNLVVNKPETNGVGLVAVMNSLPSAGFGGIGDSDARAAEGVYIKNVVLDESCSLLGRGYIGIVGMTAPWAGHVNISGLMMCGDVTANGGPNASGVFGCVMSSTCHVTINNSGMVGNVYGPKENGSFSGWLGSYAEVTNCYAVGSVEGIQDDDHYFARYSSATITNCYAKYGTQVPLVTDEDFQSGALAWRANGEQFRTGYWYQDIGEDMYPFPDPSHGTVIYAAEQYFSVANEDDLAETASAIQEYEKEAVDGTIATQAVLDEYEALIEALSEAKTILEFADAVDAVNAKKAEVAANAKVYQAYITKCEETKTYLESHDDFEGELRDALEAYLNENDEPSESNPLGTYAYIVEEHTATAEEIAAETDRVTKWLAEAIASGYVPGTDVSSLIPNYDFSKQKENWTGAWSTGYSLDRIKNEKGQYVTGVEAWNVTGDQYQTVEGMKPGYYLVGINGAFRPSNNRYSTNYAAGIYANGIFNYFPTVIEDFVPVDEAEDGVNCNLTVKSAYDLAVYSDFFSTSEDQAAENDAELLGYAVHGETGMACAANAGRYQAYTFAKVGEDGKLTIGIKNPGTKYSNDWTGWGALKVIFCGDDEAKINEALDVVIENMSARAATIIAYEYDPENAASAPNFPAALKEALLEAMAVDNLATIEAKEELAAKFSEIFEGIYAGKQAYVKLHNVASVIEYITSGNLSLVAKDEETGEWVETEEFVFNDDEIDALYDASDELLDAYESGSYSTEEALNPEVNKTVTEIVPAQDEDGYFLIGSPKQFVAFRAIVNGLDLSAKAKMIDDIDMTGIAMQPIGYAGNIWTSGVFDGQGHALKNVFVSTDFMSTSDPATLFYELKKATVKNLKLTGEYHGGAKFMGGLTRWMSEGSTVDNCDIAVAIHSAIDGDGTHGGVVGISGSTDEVISNCFVHCQFYSTEGVTTTCVGGVCGWANSEPQVKNTLIMNDYVSVSSEGSNTISRNGSTVTNVYVDKTFGDSGGTVVNADQLASGEVTWRLNGSTADDAHWFQTLGADATPHLFGGDVVYFYGGKYINEKPNPQLNAFAYNLEGNVSGSDVVVSYDLNADAEDVKVNFYNGENKVLSVAADEIFTAGTHKVTVPVSQFDVDPTTLNFEIEVKGKGSLDVLKIGDSYSFNSPYGLTVNNNPASKGFGQVLITESRPTEDREGMFSTGTPGALFAFDAAFQPVGSYYGGLDIVNETPITISGDYQFDLKDIRFSKDGRLFVGRASGTSNSSVWEINPDDLNEPWKPVFTGGELDEATGITYVGEDEQNRMAVGLALEGAGEDLKMYVLGAQRSNGEYNTTDYNCAYYNLGTAKEWSAAPSGYVAALDGVYTIAPGHVGIHEDGQGGLWYIQYRSAPSAELPAIKHYDAEGNEDYSDISTSTNSGKMAVTADGKYLAIPKGSGKVVIYETNYVPMANGKIYLNPIYNISTTETNITGLAFDYAGNLYAASSATASKTLSRYVVPSWNDNIAVTPGNGIGTAGIEGDLNGDGKVDIADAVTVLDIMAAGGYKAEADINKDQKIDIADFVSILDIMAKQ